MYPTKNRTGYKLFNNNLHPGINEIFTIVPGETLISLI